MKKIKLTIILILTISVLWSSADVLATKDYRLIKTADDAKVFLVKENRRIHIPNEQVFEAGGYKWGDIETVTKLQMNKIANTALIKSPVDAKVYLIAGGKKQWIPNEKTFLGAGLKWDDIVLIAQPQVEFYLEENFDNEDAVAVVESLTEEKVIEFVVGNDLDPFDIIDTSVVSTVDSIDNYERPDKIKIQEIGKYASVHPDVSNTSIENVRLFDDGSVLLSKNTMNEDEFISKNYTWKDGVFTPYTEVDYLAHMNNNGQKVVFSYDFSQFPVFLDNKKLTKIPTLGGYSVGVADMNNSGQLVGQSDLSGGGMDGGISHAFLWQDGVMKDLGTLGGSESHAIAINDKGQVIGYSKYDDNEDAQPFIWENNKMSMIFTPNGDHFSYVDDINNNGLILGGLGNCGNPSCKISAYLKDNELVYFGEDYNFFGVNNNDEIVGVISNDNLIDNILYHYPFNEHSEMIDRIKRVGFNDGNVAVYINGEIIKLDDLVGDENIIFTSVSSINDRGQILTTGFDFRDEYSHEYLVSLPAEIQVIVKNEDIDDVQGDDVIEEDVIEETIIKK